MRQRVTIKDIAAEVGVSRQTVTRAMNGMTRISEDTRARVLEASERLGYRPSRFASNLARSHKSRAIGFVVESLRNPYYPEVTADVLAAATERGWQVIVAAHERGAMMELISRIAADVDVVVGYLYGDQDRILAAARGVPTVMVGRPALIDGIHSVDIDTPAGIIDIVAQLRARGSRHLGFIDRHIGGPNYEPSPRRLAFEKAAPEAPADAVEPADSYFQSPDAGADAFRRLMSRHPEIDTVLAFSDLLAMGALGAAHELGMDVPGDIKIVGIDGLSLGELTYPPLSSLSIMSTDLPTKIIGVIDKIFDGTAASSEREVVVPVPLWRGTA